MMETLPRLKGLRITMAGLFIIITIIIIIIIIIYFYLGVVSSILYVLRNSSDCVDPCSTFQNFDSTVEGWASRAQNRLMIPVPQPRSMTALFLREALLLRITCRYASVRLLSVSISK